jgi:hypothetical protein
MRPSHNPSGLGTERGAVRALPVVTTRWPRAQRRGGTASAGGEAAQTWQRLRGEHRD